MGSPHFSRSSSGARGRNERTIEAGVSRGTAYASAMAASQVVRARQRRPPNHDANRLEAVFAHKRVAVARAQPIFAGAGSHTASSSSPDASSASVASVTAVVGSASGSDVLFTASSAARAEETVKRVLDGIAHRVEVRVFERSDERFGGGSGFVSAAPGKCVSNARAEAANVASACEAGGEANPLPGRRAEAGSRKSPPPSAPTTPTPTSRSSPRGRGGSVFPPRRTSP